MQLAENPADTGQWDRVMAAGRILAEAHDTPMRQPVPAARDRLIPPDPADPDRKARPRPGPWVRPPRRPFTPGRAPMPLAVAFSAGFAAIAVLAVVAFLRPAAGCVAVGPAAGGLPMPGALTGQP